MKATLLILAVVMCQSVLAADKKPLIADPIVEKAIRSELVLNKPTGELTKADLEKVKVLYFHTTKITDAGLKEVAKLEQLEALSLITIINLTDTGLKEVAKLSKLKTLELIGTKITDKGLREVAKLQKLTNIKVFGTKVTIVGMAQLQKALPKCKIDYISGGGD